MPSRLIFVGCRQFCHEKLVKARVNRYTFSNIHFNKTSAITFTMSCSLIYLLHARYFINPQILESQLNVPQTLFGWAVVNTQQGTRIWNWAPRALATHPQEQVFMQPLHKNATNLSKEAVCALKPCWLNVVLVIYNDCIVATTSIHLVWSFRPQEGSVPVLSLSRKQFLSLDNIVVANWLMTNLYGGEMTVNHCGHMIHLEPITACVY